MILKSAEMEFFLMILEKRKHTQYQSQPQGEVRFLDLLILQQQIENFSSPLLYLCRSEMVYCTHDIE